LPADGIGEFHEIRVARLLDRLLEAQPSVAAFVLIPDPAANLDVAVADVAVS
jgi:hypothetical protein